MLQVLVSIPYLIVMSFVWLLIPDGHHKSHPKSHQWQERRYFDKERYGMPWSEFFAWVIGIGIGVLILVLICQTNS